MIWKRIAASVLAEAGVVFDGDLVRIPYRLGDGRVHRWRVYARDGRCWWTPGDDLIPLGLELLPPPEEALQIALILTEGESDCFAVREAFAGRTGPGRIRGYRVLGLPGARSWKREWRLIVEPHALIYACGDGDPAGQDMVARVYRDVPWSCPVWLPAGEDARSLLQREGPHALDALLDEADDVAQMLAAFQKAQHVDEFLTLSRPSKEFHRVQ